jgi:hypothetical protein
MVTFTFIYFGCGDTRIQRFEMNVSQSIDQAGVDKMSKHGSLTLSANYASRLSGVVPYNKDNKEIPSVPDHTEMNKYGPSPDLYRNIIVGNLAERFVRVRQDFAFDSSLRTLTFAVEDEMVFREFAYPVMAGSASFSYDRSLGDGLQGTKTFQCSYEGEMNTEPQTLLQVAIEASSARIDWDKDLIQSISVKEPNLYGRNIVELHIVAKGFGKDALDSALIQKMWGDLHTNSKAVKYSSAYPTGGSYLADMSGLRFDPCIYPPLIADIVTANEDDLSTIKDRKLFVTSEDCDLTNPENEDVSTQINPDVGIPDDGTIKHHESTMDYETEHSGCDFIETVGGEAEYPFQFHLPRVLVRQTVKMVTTDQNCPIPWDDTGEPSLIWKQKISVASASVDAAGKPIYAIVATRTARVQTSRSQNSYFQSVASTTASNSLVGAVDAAGSGQGMQRRVYSPATIKAPRSTTSSNLNYTTTTDDVSYGEARRTDYIR